MDRVGTRAQRIGIIGGDGGYLRPLVEALEREGYAVLTYEPGEEAAGRVAADQPDVLVLDLAVAPVVASLRELLRREAQGQAPATIAVVRQDQVDQHDYTLGLTDFVVWPTTPAGLALRVKQALWRRANINSDNLLKFSDLIIDLANYKVYVAGRPV